MAVLDPTAPWAKHAVLESARKQAASSLWRNAAHHFGGEGLDTGTSSFAPAANIRKQFVRDGKFDQAKALDMIVCGGATPGSRFEGLEVHAATLCPLCGAPDHPKHRYYECRSLRLLPAPHRVLTNIAWTSKLANEAPTCNWECLLYRAILPADAWDQVPENKPPINFELGTLEDTTRASEQLWTDGAG